jgi:hypothetical protein
MCPGDKSTPYLLEEVNKMTKSRIQTKSGEMTLDSEVTLVIVVDETGVQRALVLADEDNLEGRKKGVEMLARLTPQLRDIDRVMQTPWE